MVPAPDEELIHPANFWPPRDRQGERIPHGFELPTWLSAVPGMLRFFDKRVPEAFWSYEGEGDHPAIVIACPCGAEPKLEFQTRCYSLGACGCERFFLFDGREVRCGRDDS